jgi:hypothetical protein
MTIEEFEKLSLMEMKEIAKNLSIKGYANVATKDKMVEKVTEYLLEADIEEISDLAIPVKGQVSEPKAKAAPMKIKDYPRIKVKVESRNPEIVDYPFSINEYAIQIQMGKEIFIPEPMVELIKSITETRFVRDGETGFMKHEEVQKFFVEKL